MFSDEDEMQQSALNIQISFDKREKLLPMHEFYDIGVSDIAYIKLTNLGIWSKSNYSLNIAEGYEVELFDYMKDE